MQILPLKPRALEPASLEVSYKSTQGYFDEKEIIDDSYKLNPVDGLCH